MKALWTAAVLAGVAAAACGQGESDINLAGTVTSALTDSAIVDAEVQMYYRKQSFLDPGVVLARTDSQGQYTLRGRDAPCEGLSLRATATGYMNSSSIVPRCTDALQQFDFQLQP